jgi:hypothetical protein
MAAVIAMLGALYFGGGQVPQTLGGPREPCWWIGDAAPPADSVCASMSPRP